MSTSEAANGTVEGRMSAEQPGSRTVHGDRVPEPMTERSAVSGWCELGERLVEKALTVGADGRLIEHIEGCPQCAEAVAS